MQKSTNVLEQNRRISDVVKATLVGLTVPDGLVDVELTDLIGRYANSVHTFGSTEEWDEEKVADRIHHRTGDEADDQSEIVDNLFSTMCSYREGECTAQDVELWFTALFDLLGEHTSDRADSMADTICASGEDEDKDVILQSLLNLSNFGQVDAKPFIANLRIEMLAYAFPKAA